MGTVRRSIPMTRHIFSLCLRHLSVLAFVSWLLILTPIRWICHFFGACHHPIDNTLTLTNYTKTFHKSRQPKRESTDYSLPSVFLGDFESSDGMDSNRIAICVQAINTILTVSSRKGYHKGYPFLNPEMTMNENEV